MKKIRFLALFLSVVLLCQSVLPAMALEVEEGTYAVNDATEESAAEESADTTNSTEETTSESEPETTTEGESLADAEQAGTNVCSGGYAR